MEYIIFILLCIIIFLACYLFFIKKELTRISKTIRNIQKDDSNALVHKEISMKQLNVLIGEINNLVKESKKNRIRYQNQNRDLRKMIMNISHDLRTPLTSALGYIDIILTSNLSITEKEKELKIVEERLNRLEELINSFFLFSKIVSTNDLPELTELNIISIIEECIARYYDDYKNNNRAIILKKNVSKIKIMSNKEMLTRIFDNLITNSYKHSTGNLEIIIKKNESLVITFSNILPNNDLDISHIFDEFYTVDMSRTTGNTGLGLAIVKEFTERLNGRVSARVTKNKKELNNILEIELKF